MFFKGTRYANVATAELLMSDGSVVQYKKIRFIDPVKPVLTHTMHQGERLDLLAHQYFRDSQRYWRICDANTVVWPRTLEEQVGQVVMIPTSSGD